MNTSSIKNVKIRNISVLSGKSFPTVLKHDFDCIVNGESNRKLALKTECERVPPVFIKPCCAYRTYNF